MSQLMPLGEDLQNVAIKELGENPNRISEDLLILKAWINQQPHLKSRMDDQFLIQFLRGSKYSLEKAKDKLDTFYTMKTKYSDLFAITDVDNEMFRKFHNTGTYVTLPKPLNANGPRIVSVRINYAAPDFTVCQIVQYTTAALEVAMISDPYACIHGICFIMDFSKLTLNHVMLITPTNFKKFVKYFEHTIPIRIKGIYAINATPAAEQLYQFVMPFFPQQLKERIVIIRNNIEELHRHIPKEYLPTEYGGENGLLEQLCEDYNHVWDKHRDFFRENAAYGVEEKLRLGKCKLEFGDDFGIGGTFRKLVVD